MENVAVIYASVGRLGEALKLHEDVLTLRRKLLGAGHAETLKAMGNLVTSYAAAGRRDEAFQLRKELLTLRPDDVNALNAAAWGLATNPDKDGLYPHAAQAVEWARRANELAPNNASLLNTLGTALYRAEQWQEAIDTLQKSIELGADVPHNWLFIAMAHWQMDQKDKAKQWYDKSLAWQTANADAAKADAELQGFFTEAAKLMAADPEEPKPNAETEPEEDQDKPAGSDKEN